MRIRHRVPSIFNLSMVDVLCCALGCVILLWLLNLREARQKSDEAGATERSLVVMTQDRDALRRQLDDTVGRLTALTSQARALEADVAEGGRALAATEKQLTATRQERDRARGQSADLDRALAALRLQKKDVEDRLARQAQDYAGLEKQLSATARSATSLAGQLRAKGTLADSLTTKLTDAEATLRKLQALADQVPGLRDEVKQARGKLAAEEELAKGLDKQLGERMRELALAGKNLKDLDAIRKALEQDLAGRDKDLAAAKDEHAKRLSLEEQLALLNKRLAERDKALSAANTRIDDLQGDKKALRSEADRLRSSAEARFAGLSLTGRRVIFLVDMSGSMELVDEQTPAPSKWQGVRDTLAKILRSSPDLEEFQVIVFSEKASFLLGEEGRWLHYDPKTSADRAVEALARIKPDGGTNMYSALEAAFQYRRQGLDTLYVLSDGLPNMGAGLDPLTAERMTEQAKGEVLGRYIRRTLKTDWNRPAADLPRVRINTVGFFYESPDVGAFLWAMSRENDGSFVGMSKP